MGGYKDLKENVLDKNLCTNCGTCIGVCPIHTISYQDETIINYTLDCINCGRCFKSCPGKEFDYKKFNKEIFGNENMVEDNALGYYKNIYSGYSSDDMVRNHAASGGVISSLLIWLLESKKVDGVVIIDQSKDHPLEYKAKIVNNPVDIINAAQSKYTIIPTNAIINELLKLNGKFAYVGLPCQIQGLRKAMANDKRLCDKVYITIGLFCGFNLSQKATYFLLRKGNINIEQVQQVSFRKKKDNKTGFYAKDREGVEFFINKHGYTFLNLIYSPKRCWMCYDYSSEFADISVGDAWEQGEGWSRIISRTVIGEKIIQDAKEANRIIIKESSPGEIYKSQKKILDYKKRGYWFRKSKINNFPEYNIDNKKLNVKSNIRFCIMFIIQLFGQTRICRGLLYLIPIRILEEISTKLRK